MSTDHPIITLLTDFGTAYHFIGVMKGVMCSITPQARIVDITHHVPSHNILSGAYLLSESIGWFPAGTVHLAIVDPGVGSSRHILAGRWGDQLIVAPDNGLVSMVYQTTPATELYEVSNREYFLPETGSTFHGRDIMAPVAAHLAGGVELRRLGQPLDRPLIIQPPQPRLENGNLIGQIIHIDRFGNLISNITAERLSEFGPADVLIDHVSIGQVNTTYVDVPTGKATAMIGSTRKLEIAVNQGNAQHTLQVSVGQQVRLVARKD